MTTVATYIVEDVKRMNQIIVTHTAPIASYTAVAKHMKNNITNTNT